MASVFKRNRDRQRKGASWYIAYTDENRKRHTVQGCPDKAMTQQLAAKLQGDVELRRRGILDPKAAGYVTHANRPIEEHIHDFGSMLDAKESTAKHVRMTTRFIRELARLVGAETIRGLNAEAVQQALATLRREGLSARTVNSYLRGVKSFSRWLVKAGRAREDSLAHLSMLNEKTDRRRVRRALSPDEAVRLIQAAEASEPVMGMDGESRAVMYALMLAAGVRRSEAGSLTPESFRLEGDPATVTILASYSKRRRDDLLPLPSTLAERLGRWLAGRDPDRPVFQMPDKPHKMFYRDLAAAGIKQETATGVIDLHSLRHTFVTNVVGTGATVKTAQELARHSTPTLTFGVYAHARLHDVASTVERLPDPFASNQPNILAATGTAPVPPDRHDLTALCQRAGAVSGREQSQPDATTSSNAPALAMGCAPEKQDSSRIVPPADGGCQEARPVGFEPTTFGFEVRDSIR